MGRLAWSIAFVAGCAACGGRVDPAFTEPIVEAPRAMSAPARDLGPQASFTKPKLVVIRSDDCVYCRAAQPGIDTAYGEYEARVDLVVLDVTDDAASDASARLAEHEGVGRFFATYRGRTPTVGVFVGPDEGRLVHGALEDPATLTRELAYAVGRFREDHAAPRDVTPLR